MSDIKIISKKQSQYEDLSNSLAEFLQKYKYSIDTTIDRNNFIKLFETILKVLSENNDIILQERANTENLLAKINDLESKLAFYQNQLYTINQDLNDLIDSLSTLSFEGDSVDEKIKKELINNIISQTLKDCCSMPV